MEIRWSFIRAISLAIVQVSVMFNLTFPNTYMYCFYLMTCCNLDCVLFLKIRVMDLWAVFGWTGGGLCALYVLLPFLVRFYPWIAHRIVFLHFGKPYPFSFSLSLSSLPLSLSLWVFKLSVCQWGVFFSFLS